MTYQGKPRGRSHPFHANQFYALIAHWPRGIAARGELRRQVGHIIDLMPTLTELAGAGRPAEFR